MGLRDWFNLAQTAAVIGASITALYGINSWRREMKGKKRYELAEEVLTLFYKTKDVISSIRNPFGHRDEGKSRPAAPGESPEQKEARDQAYSLWERVLKNDETFNRLSAMRYRVIAIFGKKAMKPFDYLDKIIGEFRTAVFMMADAFERAARPSLQPTKEDSKELAEQIRKYRAIYYEGLEVPDPINEIVDKMIAEIEAICVPDLRKEK